MDTSNAKVLAVVSCLMDYPREDILLYKGELDQVVAEAGLAPAIETKLLAFIENRAAMDLMDWQSEYGGLFDRGRSVALWLFEHVHGESRDPWPGNGRSGRYVPRSRFRAGQARVA